VPGGGLIRPSRLIPAATAVIIDDVLEEMTMSKLVEKACGLLKQMYNADEGVFSATSSLVGGKVVNDFTNRAQVMRYTVNSLYGAHTSVLQGEGDWDILPMTDRFLDRQLANVVNPGDKGLLLAHLARLGHARASALHADIKNIANNPEKLGNLAIQELAWLIYGVTKYSAATGSADDSAKVAETLYRHMISNHTDKDSHLPRHTTRGLRKSVVGFGGIVYYLMSLAEYDRVFKNDDARQIFKSATRRIISLQGTDGSWPWFYHVNPARVVDRYEVYSVHQASMAMLFLFPAIDAEVSEARQSVERSVSWMFGNNELGEVMIKDDPFFTYRSIRRRKGGGRALRLVRGLWNGLTDGDASKPAPRSHLEVNPECRSYELGWILHVWPGRVDFPAFTSLADLTR
jgi:hypothetical protein